MNRLHPRVRILWAMQALLFAGVFAVAVFVVGFVVFDGQFLPWAPVAAFAILAFVGVSLAVLRYRVWRYEVRDDAIYLERGVFTRVRTVVPYVRIQHVDSSRGPVERAVGLASIVVYTAGSRGADVTIPGLGPEGADELRERLKRLAIRAEGDDAV